jgi:hypothetical protein
LISSEPSRCRNILHGEQTHEIDSLRDDARQLACRSLDLRIAKRNDSEIEDMIRMIVAADGKCRKRTVDAACHEDGKFEFEIDKAFEHRRLPGEWAPHFGRVIVRCDFPLALAVVTKRRGLQHGGCADFCECGVEFTFAVHPRKRRQRQSGISEKFLLPQTLLCDVQDAARRTDFTKTRAPFDSLRGDVLELERQHIHAARKVEHRCFIVITRGHFAIRELAGRRVFIRRESVHAITHAARGDGKHAPELAAAHHADGRAGKKGPRRIH